MFTLQCEKKELWQGSANVVATFENKQTIVFHEKGAWDNQKISFTNVLRWTLHPDTLSLEHLRLGYENPVYLLHLAPTKHGCLDTIDPHLCKQDSYSAQAFLNQEGIHLFWTIQGPSKNETIYSHYQ
jgi:hypothetical protein